MSELQNYHNNCSDICIRFNSKKYIVEEKLCINDGSNENIYNFEYNNICYENCPNDIILSNGNYLCMNTNTITNKRNNSNHKITYIIIGVIAGIIIIGGIVVFLIVKKKV